MDVFLAEVGRRVAEKWLSLLTLPGLLLVTAATVGHTLGHRGWADIGELVDTGRRHAADLSRAGALTTVLVAVTMVLLATGAAWLRPQVVTPCGGCGWPKVSTRSVAS